MILNTCVINTRRQIIAPNLGYVHQQLEWAEQYPDMYTLRTASMVYADERALNWFLLRWN